MSSIELPPPPSNNYILWRKDIELWKKLTDTPRTKMGYALQYACRKEERIHEAVLNIPENLVDGENGINNVLKVLDALHVKDKREAAWEYYNNFISLKRKINQSVANFILEFEASYEKVKSFGNQLSEDYLPIKLLQAANLSEVEERIVKASTLEFNFCNVKDTLKRMFGESTDNLEVKENRQNKPTSTNKTYTSGEMSFHTKKERMKNRKSNKPAKHPKILCQQNNLKYGKNSLDKFGNISHCYICLSANHHKAECPDRSTNNKLPYSKSPHVVFFGEKSEDHFSSASRKFNETVCVDIRSINGHLVILLIDTYTKYLEAGEITSKDPKIVLDFMLRNWISVFGPPEKFIFNNKKDKIFEQELMSITKIFNINLVTTDLLWLITLVDNHVKPLTTVVSKILKDIHCPFSIAVYWSVFTLNSNNDCNLSPSLHVFGQIVLLPCVEEFKPPTKSLIEYNNLLEEHLMAKRKTRNSYVFVEAASAVKLHMNQFDDINCEKEIHFMDDEIPSPKIPQNKFADEENIKIKENSIDMYLESKTEDLPLKNMSMQIRNAKSKIKATNKQSLEKTWDANYHHNSKISGSTINLDQSNSKSRERKYQSSSDPLEDIMNEARTIEECNERKRK